MLSSGMSAAAVRLHFGGKNSSAGREIVCLCAGPDLDMCVCAQVPTYKAGTAAFQEVPTTEIYKPITKGAFAVTSAEQVSNGSNTAAAL